MDDIHDADIPRPLPPPPATAEEMLWRVINAAGWGRRLDVRNVPGTQLWQVVSVPDAGQLRDDGEIVFTVSEGDFLSGLVTSGHAHAECRRFMLGR